MLSGRFAGYITLELMETPAGISRPRKREALGLLFAPAVPGLLFLALGLARGGERLAWTFALLTAVMSYLAAVVLGIPLHVLLRRFRFASLPIYLGAGAVLGLLGYVCFFLPQLFAAQTMSLDFVIEVAKASRGFAVHGVLCGAIAAFVFWLIALWREGGPRDEP